MFRNIKDIAKLRGSEDLWEVAKLHGRESSFPEVLIVIYSDLIHSKSIIALPINYYCTTGAL